MDVERGSARGSRGGAGRGPEWAGGAQRGAGRGPEGSRRGPEGTGGSQRGTRGDRRGVGRGPEGGKHAIRTPLPLYVRNPNQASVEGRRGPWEPPLESSGGPLGVLWGSSVIG